MNIPYDRFSTCLLYTSKNLLALEVSPGRSTPYYYKADGVMEAYIRVGNESVIAPDDIVNELILKGTNQSFVSQTEGDIIGWLEAEAGSFQIGCLQECEAVILLSLIHI